VKAAGQATRTGADRYRVIYDGDCTVCTRIATVLERWGGDLLDVQPSTEPSDSLQVISPDGRLWERGPAVEQLLRVLPRGRLITWVFHIPFVRGLTDRFYRWFARNRYRLGCGKHCPYRGENTSDT
jgi:predicted DCC family thiol-disulfide oxidoreductase YuxK